MIRRTFRSLDLFSSEVCATQDVDLSAPERELPRAPLAIRGNGLSIVGASFGRGCVVLRTARREGVLDFNPECLRITVSAAMTLGELYEALAEHRLAIRSMPSYPGVTVGGCIAGNVHGQNHYREGCFGNQVVGLTLFHPRHGRLTVTREDNRQLFDLTVGGFGLTGIILDATLRLQPMRTNMVAFRNVPFTGVEDAFAIMTSEKDNYDLFHSWCDWTGAPGRERGYVSLGKLTGDSAFMPETIARNPGGEAIWKVPVNVFGTPALQLLNQMYYARSRVASSGVRPLSAFVFPSQRRLFYFSMFGRRGILEHQVLIPLAAASAYFRGFKAALARTRPLVALCHFKLFNGARRLLNFDGQGFAMAVHVARNAAAMDFLAEIDQLDIELGCITNLMRDSRVALATIRRQYQGFEEFVDGIRSYDPDLTFQNTITQKLFEAA